MIQFIDLKTQYSRIQDDIEAAVLRTMRSGQYIMGPEVAALEERLAAFVGMKHAISCASGTDALVMALMAKGVGPGDAVFTVPFTFMASAEAIATVGATPIFVDVDETTFNIDPAALDRAIRALADPASCDHPLPRINANVLGGLTPKGIIAVDLFGLPADYQAINAIAEAHGLFVIEDAAQSFGGARDNRRAGGLAEIGCTSFFPAKPLGCYGDGGAIFTDDDACADVLRSIRVHGQGADKYENVRLGLTGRLDAVQAAVLNIKLNVFEDELVARVRVAHAYGEAIAAAGVDLVTPSIPAGYASAWAQYTLIARDSRARTVYQNRLAEAGVPTMIYYPIPLHLQKAFSFLNHSVGDFPISEKLGERVFSVPMHPYLEDAQVSAIVEALAGAEA